jgi:serine phosphatase RsbU (regulator of sigma subunit)
MLYGEVRPGGHFRFVNFGHPPPLVFSAEYRKFMKIDESRMVQFVPLGLQIPADHPDRRKYYSMNWRQTELNSSDVAEITLMSPGDLLVLYTDGVYDGSDHQGREILEAVLREHYRQSALDICNALLDHAVKQDQRLRENGDEVLIDDKTVFIVKRI